MKEINTVEEMNIVKYLPLLTSLVTIFFFNVGLLLALKFSFSNGHQELFFYFASIMQESLVKNILYDQISQNLCKINIRSLHLNKKIIPV